MLKVMADYNNNNHNNKSYNSKTYNYRNGGEAVGARWAP